VLSPALVASFPVPLASAAVPRRTVHRLHVRADRGITELVRRLAECGVEVLDVRPLAGRPDADLPDRPPDDGFIRAG
jgi:hypothetical protein